MGFFNGNGSLAFFGRIVVRSAIEPVFYCGLFKTFKFSLILSWLFRGGGGGGGQGMTYLATSSCVRWLKTAKYRKIHFLAFCTKFERHTFQVATATLVNLRQGSC